MDTSNLSPLEIHDQLLLDTYEKILGIDEAGRGPLAGPVVMAGVIINTKSQFIKGVNDSKKVTEKKRAQLYTKLIQTHQYATAIIDHLIIDSIGIGNAVIKGMREIIAHIPAPYIIIDGYFKQGSFPPQARCIIDGDAKSYAIAAASIIAKYTRDQIMITLDNQYPVYQFKKHKGYGTKEHRELIAKYGLSEIHRKSFTLHTTKL